MEEELNWGLIICVEIILLISILSVIFYGVYMREAEEVRVWKERAKYER